MRYLLFLELLEVDTRIIINIVDGFALAVPFNAC